jgi:hypothetical protein
MGGHSHFGCADTCRDGCPGWPGASPLVRRSVGMCGPPAGIARCPDSLRGPAAGDNRRMVDDIARERAIYQALMAADEVAAALQAHLMEEHQADLERAAAQSTFTNSLKLLRQARERLGQGLRAVEAGDMAESDEISLRNP